MHRWLVGGGGAHGGYPSGPFVECGLDSFRLSACFECFTSTVFGRLYDERAVIYSVSQQRVSTDATRVNEWAGEREESG